MKSQEQDHEKKFTLANCVFTEKFFREIYPFLHSQILQSLQKECWYFLLTPSYIQLLTELRKSICRQFGVAFTPQLKQQPISILKIISQVSFLKLKQLALIQNHITNIELLPFLDLQNLHNLQLSSNNIVSIKPLNKTKWSKLQLLYLNDNYLTNLQVDRIKANPKFQGFTIDWHNGKGKEYQMENPNVIFKFQPNELRFLDMLRYPIETENEKTNLIYSKKIRSKLGQKWNGCNVRWKIWN